ncbi:MAG TPA: hypothetical protein VEL76_05655 [Gemmataceae bacterium]|nr:hypothetical protein [Gemmataceae bacterium]
MSTPPAPRASGPGSTRQLLDDLDALMQQLLTLPVNQLEDDPAPPANAVTVPTVSQAPSGDLAQGPAQAPEAVQPAVEPAGKRVISHPPAPALPAPHTTEDPPTSRPPAQPEPAPEESPVLGSPRPLPLEPAPLPPIRLAPLSVPPPVRRSPLPPEFTLPAAPTSTVPAPAAPFWRRVRIPAWAWRTILWSNRTFDRSTRWLGNSGRWLRGTRGRRVLGWVGLLLWSVALTLVILRLIG